jgi:hypothetical protein
MHCGSLREASEDLLRWALFLAAAAAEKQPGYLHFWHLAGNSSSSRVTGRLL